MKTRIFYGWWVIILGSLINAVGMGILYQSFTVFFLPLKRDLGVSSAAISLLYGAARLEGGIEGPIVGHLIDLCRQDAHRYRMVCGGSSDWVRHDLCGRERLRGGCTRRGDRGAMDVSRVCRVRPRDAGQTGNDEHR